MALLALGASAACVDPNVPTDNELYGSWIGTADGIERQFQFAAVDGGTYPELEGVFNTYLLYNNGVIVQTGHYAVERREVTGYGETDALVTMVLSGPGVGQTFGNAILGWREDELTLSSESALAGQIRFVRAGL